jgi:WD40 repeat protein
MGLAFSSDGKLLFPVVESFGGESDRLAVDRTDTWETVWSIATKPLFLKTLALSPDGQFAAIAGEVAAFGPPIIHRPQILIVDFSERQVVPTIFGAFPDQNEIQTLAWSPDGQLLAAGAIVQSTFPGPDVVKIFNPRTGAQMAGEPVADTAYAHVSGLSYSPDGQYLVEGYLDGKVRIWDGKHTKLLQAIPVSDHFHTVVGVSRDIRYFAIGDGKEISVWELMQSPSMH